MARDHGEKQKGHVVQTVQSWSGKHEARVFCEGRPIAGLLHWWCIMGGDFWCASC